MNMVIVRSIIVTADHTLFNRLEATDNTCTFNMFIVFCIIVTADRTPFYRLELYSSTINIVLACSSSIIVLRGVCCVYGHHI